MTEIYGTLGPACAAQDTMESMFTAGLTGMRLNLSHCDLADATEQIVAFHAAAAAVGAVPQLVIDTQGPELRLGNLDCPVVLIPDTCVSLGQGGLPIPTVLLAAMEPDDEVLLDDGKISLRVISVNESRAEALVIRGGNLTGHKSVKLTGKQIPLPVLTERDIKNIQQAEKYGVTGLLQPFVRSGEELRELRHILKENNGEHLKLFAKIETLDAVSHLDDIIPEADVIVIARGDLGNDMPLWKLPAIQKHISAACRAAGKPFIVVTQMLASMENAPVPTRAEVSDIFNAVADGAWGVMLTGETAVGRYPVEAIHYLAETAKDACRWIEE